MADGKDAVSAVAADDREFLRERRMRRARAPQRPPRWVWLLIALLHLLFVAGLRDLMHPPEFALRIRAEDDSVLVVRFIPTEPATEIAIAPPTLVAATQATTTPSSVLPSEIRPPQEPRTSPRQDNTMRASFVPRDAVVAAPAPAPRLNLLNPDGSMRLSQEVIAASDPKSPLYRSRAHESQRFMKHESPIEYKATRFESAWVPRDETIVGEFFRKATVEKTVKTPWGSKIKCGWILVIGGCSFGAAPTPLANAPRAPEPTNPVPPAPEPPAEPPPIAPYDPPPRS